MSKAVMCPVCGGSGKITEKTDWQSTSATDNEKVCHGCGGRGWVEVSSSLLDKAV